MHEYSKYVDEIKAKNIQISDLAALLDKYIKNCLIQLNTGKKQEENYCHKVLVQKQLVN